KPNNQFNINKLVSIKLGTLLSSQTTITIRVIPNCFSQFVFVDVMFQCYFIRIHLSNPHFVRVVTLLILQTYISINNSNRRDECIVQEFFGLVSCKMGVGASLEAAQPCASNR
ncbi:hypothetical protein, partial [Arthrobacter glacialis]